MDDVLACVCVSRDQVKAPVTIRLFDNEVRWSGTEMAVILGQ